MKRIIVLTVAALMATMIAVGPSVAFAQVPCDPFTDICPPPEPPPDDGGGGGGGGSSTPGYYYNYWNYGTTFHPVDPIYPTDPLRNYGTTFYPTDPIRNYSTTFYPTDPVRNYSSTFYPTDPVRNYSSGYGGYGY